MKIEKVSYNKVKVTVTTLDMLKWGISMDSFTEDTPETRELFWTLIKRAEEETGFSVENSRLVVEAMPHKYDGVVLFVTKLEEDFIDLPANIRKSRIRAKAMTPRFSSEIFLFQTFEEICDYVKTLDYIDFDGDLYSFENRYYLVMPYMETVNAKLLEYGKKLPKNEASLSFLKEHGSLVAKGNALETIEKHFCR